MVYAITTTTTTNTAYLNKSLRDHFSVVVLYFRPYFRSSNFMPTKFEQFFIFFSSLCLSYHFNRKQMKEGRKKSIIFLVTKKRRIT